MVGRLCDQSLHPHLSRAIAQAYCRAYSVDMDEVAPQSAPYGSFDAFFTRALREGARGISTDPLVSPADGALLSSGDVDHASRINVKGRPYDVAELIGDPELAARYRGGQFAVVYLSPRDYHRVHSPVAGTITSVRGIPGDLFPVNAIGERHIPRLFVRNNRVEIAIETPDVGRVSVIMVGAVIVGRISVNVIDAPAPPPGLTRISPPRAVQRGDEIGMFHLGSTVVLLVEPGLQIARPTGSVRYGESLTRAP
ncbi:MAG TPA: archaetidylserine decarboxylase [Polyangiaceae bacterium]